MLRCKGCGEGVSAVVIRLKNHASNCKALKAKGLWIILGPVQSSQSTLRVTSHFLSMESTKSAHTTEFLTAFTAGAIQEVKRQFGIQVIAIVTDGAANMVSAPSCLIFFCMPSHSLSECNAKQVRVPRSMGMALSSPLPQSAGGRSLQGPKGEDFASSHTSEQSIQVCLLRLR